MVGTSGRDTGDHYAFVDERGVLQQQRVSRPLEQESTRTVQSQGGWKFYGFPGFKWKSVIGVVVAIQLIVYVMSLWLIRPRGVLQPTSHVLWVFGASNRDAETCGVRDNFPHHLWELRRWFVPIFLHGNPMHIMLNLYFECSAGPRIEERDSSLAFALLFLGAGMMGNLLSAAVGGGVSVGGSTSCYGIIGMDMALWYQRWNDLAPEEREHAKQGIVSSVESYFSGRLSCGRKSTILDTLVVSLAVSVFCLGGRIAAGWHCLL